MKNIHTKQYILLLLLLLGAAALGGCRKFLDANPNKQFAAPSSIQDLLAILDAKTMSTGFPAAADEASDDYFLTYATWSALSSLPARMDYNWDPNAANDQDWDYGYSNIESANVVLDGLKTLSAGNDASDYNNAKGMALFFRGYNYALLVNIFTLPFNASGSSTLPGLPIKLTSDITAKITRSTMAATYQQIIADMQGAIALLPVTPLSKTRPSKPAAYAALARLYLDMGDYANAGAYADSCLRLYNTLIDYNTLNASSSEPFQLFNAEVIFHATSKGSQSLTSSRERVDTLLYNSYDANDLRKQLFFKPATGGYYFFKGDYSGTNSSLLFDGLATSEVLLIHAEAAARQGDGAQAISDLNTLLKNRYAAGTFTPYPSTLTADSALSLVIEHRRKELAFKSGVRWGDLRRLSSDSRFAVTPERILNGQVYMLQPGDKRYAFLLPLSVVQAEGIEQNAR